jgi:hypothetical protein
MMADKSLPRAGDSLAASPGVSERLGSTDVQYESSFQERVGGWKSDDDLRGIRSAASSQTSQPT